MWRLRVSLSSSVFPSLLNRRLGGRLFLFDLLSTYSRSFFLAFIRQNIYSEIQR